MCFSPPGPFATHTHTPRPSLLQYAKVKPVDQASSGGGRGLLATADIASGECLVSVPLSAALRVYPGCPPALGCPAPTWQQLPWQSQLALTLLAEVLQGRASKWSDYLAVLPADVDLPAVWSDREVEQLQCAYFIQQVINLQTRDDVTMMAVGVAYAYVHVPAHACAFEGHVVAHACDPRTPARCG